MQKLILLALLTTSSLFCDRSDERRIYMYRDVPEWEYNDNAILQFALVSAALSSKYTEYALDNFEDHEIVFFKVYNDNGEFFLRFDKESRECEIEFNARDDSFNYDNFKKMIDFFLCD